MKEGGWGNVGLGGWPLVLVLVVEREDGGTSGVASSGHWRSWGLALGSYVGEPVGLLSGWGC